MTNEPQIDWPERLREWNTFYPTDITTRALEAYDRMKGELSLSNDLVKGLEGNLKACEDDNERLRQWKKDALPFITNFKCERISEVEFKLRLQKEAE